MNRRGGGSLEFRQVSFRYPSARPTSFSVGDVSFRIESGERVAIMGPTGSGKTTIARLAAGLLPPTSGEVRLDPGDTQAAAPGDIPAVLFLPQGRTLFSASVHDNVALFSPSIRPPSVKDALRMLGLTRLTADAALAEKLDPSTVSSSDAQLISLSRCLVTVSPFVLLDEPTANLGTEESRLVHQVLSGMEDRGVVMITHRPETARQCHRVLLMTGGRIVDSGDPGAILDG